MKVIATTVGVSTVVIICFLVSCAATAAEDKTNVYKTTNEILHRKRTNTSKVVQSSANNNGTRKRLDIVLQLQSSEEDNPNKKVASKTAAQINLKNGTSKLKLKTRGTDYRYRPWPTPTQLGDEDFYPDFFSESTELSSSSSSETREGFQITTPCPGCQTKTTWTTPGWPKPTTPGWPKPTTPGWPKPSTPGWPKPSTPGWPKPTTPGWPSPITPGWPKPTPGWPKLTTPGWPSPITPGWPKPTTPSWPSWPTPGWPGPTPKVSWWQNTRRARGLQGQAAPLNQGGLLQHVKAGSLR